MSSMSRRSLLRSVAGGATLVSVAALRSGAARAADGPLISENDPAAKAVKYVDDAKNAKAAKPGSTCASCALYQGKDGAKSGPCQIFPGKSVTAAGWCASWAPQI
jgi:hypothetical protein